MKFLVILVIVFCGQTLGQHYTFSYGREEEGQYLLGYDFSSTNATETSGQHQVSLSFTGSEGTRITHILGNAYPVSIRKIKVPIIQKLVIVILINFHLVLDLCGTKSNNPE